MNKEIKQLIPCNAELYALYEDKTTGEIFKHKVLAFALCDDGCVYPQVFDRDLGIDFSACDNANGFELGKDSAERIVDALEAISGNLSEISVTLDNIDQNLDGCIAQNGRNKFLCVTGNMQYN